jgi:TetR/AcrR family acrAB operon transcriptional repressor
VTKTSLAEIAAAAGVTRGAVYWHFKDKPDLFAAMCERATLPLDALLDQAAGKTHVDPLGTLRELAVAALNRLATDPRAQAVFEVIFHKAELTDELSDIAGRQERDRGNCLSNVEAILQQAVRAEQLPPDTDTALATRLLHAFVSGVMREWVLDKSAYDLAAHAPSLVDTIIAGLAANPPRRGGRIRPRVRPRAGAAA